MDESDLRSITDWVIGQGLAGTPEADMLAGFCERCRTAGLPLDRAVVLIDTLHPVHEGHAFFWRSDGVVREPTRYGRTDRGEAAAAWRRTTFFRLLETGGEDMHLRLDGATLPDFYLLDSFAEEGQVDYIACVHRFAEAAVATSAGAIGEMDCVYSHWTTQRASGFAAADLAAIRRLGRPLALAVKASALGRVAETLAEVYLGNDAARRVLGGRIQRGVPERIGAVLWFSDLRGYTTISDTAVPEAIIPLLNDYADAVVTSIHEASGDVLKLIGDAVLGVFHGSDTADGCRRALAAEAALRARVADLNARRAAAGEPVTTVYLGLHVGEVLYGNIGSEYRLDFTVVGPAVNEVARIASMCRSADRLLLVSQDFRDATPEPERTDLVSVGRYALRGVGRAQELFTLDPGLSPDSFTRTSVRAAGSSS